MIEQKEDQRLVHRLESFGDVVIGFSLAELGLSLVVPRDPLVFFTSPSGIGLFLFTFALVASIWWNYTTLFHHYFVPKMTTILATFAMLGGTVLLVFSLQMTLHPGYNDTQQIEASYAYFGTFAVVYGLQFYLYLVGLRTKWAELAPDLRVLGIRRTCLVGGGFLGIVTGFGVAAVADATAVVVHFGSTTLGFPYPLVFLVVGAAAARVVRQVLVSRAGLSAKERGGPFG
jgi:uncharacterized membrane protein